MRTLNVTKNAQSQVFVVIVIVFGLAWLSYYVRISTFLVSVYFHFVCIRIFVVSTFIYSYSRSVCSAQCFCLFYKQTLNILRRFLSIVNSVHCIVSLNLDNKPR